jgi:hypothetical protein
LTQNQLSEFLFIYLVPKTDVFRQSGDCFISERYGKPINGWYFPLLMDWEFIFKYSEPKLNKTWQQINLWLKTENQEICIFPLLANEIN